MEISLNGSRGKVIWINIFIKGDLFVFSLEITDTEDGKITATPSTTPSYSSE